MRRRPPHFCGEAFAQFSQRLDRAGEEQRLAQGHDLGPQALLPRLGEEGPGVGRNDDAGDDVDALLLEGADLRGKVVVHVLEATRVDEPEPFLRERSREAAPLVAPGVAVAVVGEEASHGLLRLHGLPSGDEVRDHVLEAPEEVVRPVEPLLRIAVAPEEPGLPGHHRRDAGHLVQLACVADRIGRLRRGRDEDQVHLVLQDQIARHLARAVGTGLAVLVHDLNRRARGQKRRACSCARW